MITAVLAVWMHMPMAIMAAEPAHEAPPPAYRFKPLDESIAQPWHKTCLPEAVTPPGELNAAAEYIDGFLELAFKDSLEKSMVKTPWRTCDKFLSWAVWGYLSPDSKYRGDERLVTMSRAWIEGFLEKINTRPANPKEAESWVPGLISESWGFEDYSEPLLEIEQDPKLKAAIGEKLCNRYRTAVISAIEVKTTPEKFNTLIDKADTYVNMATHPMAVYIHGWLLTGEEKYLKMAQSVVAILRRDQMPNGMFPYRLRMHGERHLEFETMYYRAIEMRALFMYWWATRSPRALECLERSRPWYPLNLEPPYHFNAGPDIWWKEQWRTFWSLHVAMVAAATGDGENAAIARRMAADKIGHDRFDLVLGALAFNLLAAVPSKPVRDGYVIHDPDIRGLRLRAAPWSCTFTAGSFTHTRASAMLVDNHGSKGKAFDALSAARTCVRVQPLELVQKIEADYTTLEPEGAELSYAISGNVAAAGTTYAPMRPSDTWNSMQRAPWRMREVWFMTPHGLIGIIDSEALEDQDAYEFNHQFRFIVAYGELKKDGGNAWLVGGLRFQVWESDFPEHVVERVRRFAMTPTDRSNFQVSLVDRSRPPEEIAQGSKSNPGGNDSILNQPRLPKKGTISKGYRRTTLASVVPKDGPQPEAVKRLAGSGLVGFTCRVDGKLYDVVYNPTEKPVEWKVGTSAEPITVAPRTVQLVQGKP